MSRPHSEIDANLKKEATRFLNAQKHQKDSLQIIHMQNIGRMDETTAIKKINPFPFDPNKMDEKTGLKLGLSQRQITIIQNYLKKKGHFSKKEDFNKIYCISDAEYKLLAPYIQIKPITKYKPSNYKTIELNTCSAKGLSENLHFRKSLAERTIKYRNLVGNFYTPNQLKEVYGLSQRLFSKIKSYVYCDTLLLKKININTASFKTLLHNPYLNYETTLKIIKTREKLNYYTKIKQLRTVADIPDSTYYKIRHYLYIRPLK